MRKHRSVMVAVTVACVVGSGSPALWSAQEGIDAPGAVPYTSGGVGSSARDDMEMDKGGEYSLKLVFAYENGDYLSDVAVTIADASGKALLSATSDGPWFYAKLPPGTYDVTATFAGQTQRFQTKVPASGLQVEQLRWDTPAGGG